MAENWKWMENYLFKPEDDLSLPALWPRVGKQVPDQTDCLYPLWMKAKDGLANKTANPFELLRARARDHPSKPALLWLNEAGETQIQWTYHEFLAKIRTVAYYLSRKYEPGQRIVLCFEPGLDFFVSFWACLSTGIIAVPVCPPDPFSSKNDVALKLKSIINDSDPVCILTSSFYHNSVMAAKAYFSAQGLLPEVDLLQIQGKRWVVMNKLKSISASLWDFEDVATNKNGDDVAFLQYTSGSTGNPKGVIVSQENLQDNSLQCIAMTRSIDSFLYYKYSIALSWLPTFHDMGLIGFHVSLMMIGVTCINLSPVDFISNPAVWLQACSRYKRVVTGGPPFALDLCVRKISEADMTRIDLRRVSGIVLGAEPIRHQSLENFAAKFQNVGFSPCAFLPCYGLAENVLFVIGKGADDVTPSTILVDTAMLKFGVLEPSTSKKKGVQCKGEGAGHTKKERWLVSSGEKGKDTYKRSGIVVLIVNPTNCAECKDGQVGEIWVSGPCKTKGYWDNPAATKETFGGVLRSTHVDDHEDFVTKIGKSPPTTFIRTGDLGAFYNGQLFVTGRCKDALIFNGANYFPQDIEDAATASNRAVRPGAVCAFAVEDQDHSEQLCVLVEVRDKNDQMMKEEKLLGRTENSGVAKRNDIVVGLTMEKAAMHVMLSVAAALPTYATATAYKAYTGVKKLCGRRPVSDSLSYSSGYIDSDSDQEEHKQETVAEVRRLRQQYSKAELASIIEDVSSTVQQHFGVAVFECVLVTPKTVKKTSSGKLRRQATRNAWVNSELNSFVVAYHSTQAGNSIDVGLWDPVKAVIDEVKQEESKLEQKQKLNRSALSPVAELAEETYDDSSESEEDTKDERTGEEAVSNACLVDKNAVKQRIFDIVTEELGDDEELMKLMENPANHDTSLLTAGVDSLTITKIAAQLSKDFNLRQPLSPFMFIAEPTLNGVAKVITQLSALETVKRVPTTVRSSEIPFNPHSTLPCILGIGTSVPELGGPQSLIIEAMSKSMQLSEKRKLQLTKIGKGSAIETRHTVLKGGEEIFWNRTGVGNDAGMDVRNEKYKEEAPKLAIAAAKKALADWGGNKMEITHVVSVSCTGIIIPGLEFQVMVGLDLSPKTERLSITFMGCFGALAGLKAANCIAAANSRNRVLVVCCELCSLHLQMNEKIDNLIASALFADGCGSFVVGAQPRDRESALFQIHKTASTVIPNTLEMMKWELSQTGFIIGLSKEISGQIFMNIKKFCRSALLKVQLKNPNVNSNKLVIAESDCIWAVHPGGAMIVQAIQEALGVTSKHTQASWDTMRDYGNMSSATLVFVWDHIRKQKSSAPHTFVPSLAFGPGLNVEGAMLRRCT